MQSQISCNINLFTFLIYLCVFLWLCSSCLKTDETGLAFAVNWRSLKAFSWMPAWLYLHWPRGWISIRVDVKFSFGCAFWWAVLKLMCQLCHIWKKGPLSCWGAWAAPPTGFFQLPWTTGAVHSSWNGIGNGNLKSLVCTSVRAYANTIMCIRSK